MSWTSTWRASPTSRSISTLGSPNACSASARARSNAGARASLRATRRLPRPPPPAPALILRGGPRARGGLDQEREPQALGLRHGVLHRVDRAAGPRRHGDARLLGEPLALDLVAQRAHDLGVRADEDDPETVAQLREARMLGDE